MKVITTKKPQASLKVLSGCRILVGRARHQASALSFGLRELGAEVLEIPFIEIRKPHSYLFLDTALRSLAAYDWLILTSVNGVDALVRRMGKLGISNRQLSKLKIAAIGPATKKAIQDQGMKADVMPKEYVAESVVRSLRHKVKGKRVLLVRAAVARDVIPRELRTLGAKVDVVEAYETVVPKSSRSRLQSALKDSKRCPDIVTFTSSSTAKNFVELAKPMWRGHPRPRKGVQPSHSLKFASIGPVTSATLRDLGLPVDIEAKQFTIPGLIAAIVAAHS